MDGGELREVAFAMRCLYDEYLFGVKDTLDRLFTHATQIVEDGDTVALRIPIEDYRAVQEAVVFAEDARRRRREGCE
jgi:hypothetical protein